MSEDLPTLPPNASLWTRLNLAMKCLQVLQDDPGHPHYGPLFNACLESGTYAKIARRWRKTHEGQAMLEDRPSMQGPDLDLAALEALPAHTLGHGLFRYFHDLGIDPFVSDFPIENDVDFLSKRYRETHDILHVLTGYEIDDYSEMELQAFVFGNMGLKQCLMIMTFGPMRMLPKVGPWKMRHYVSDLRKAYKRGKASKNLLGVRFEDMWDRPLEDVQRELVAPAPPKKHVSPLLGQHAMAA